MAENEKTDMADEHLPQQDEASRSSTPDRAGSTRSSFRSNAGIAPRTAKGRTFGKDTQKRARQLLAGAPASFDEMAAHFRQDRSDYENILNQAAKESGYEGSFRQGPVFAIYRLGSYAACFSESGKMTLLPVKDGEDDESEKQSAPDEADTEAIRAHNAILRENEGYERFGNLARAAAMFTLADDNEKFRKLYETDPQRAVQEYAHMITKIFQQSYYARIAAALPGSFSI